MLIIPLGKKGSEGIPVITLFVCLACILVLVFANTPAHPLFTIVPLKERIVFISHRCDIRLRAVRSKPLNVRL